MVVAITRPTKIKISKAAVKHNIQAVRNNTQARLIFLAVKANAYGFGLVEMAQASVAGGVDGFGVATLDEALELRKAQIDVPILVMGIVPAQYAQLMAENHIMATVSDMKWLTDAQKQLQGTNPLLINIGVDTGMGRIGFRDEQTILEAIKFIQDHPQQFTYQGLMTHFSDADSTSDEYFHKQLKRWHAMTDRLPQPPMVHVANSGAAMYHADELPTKMVRVGSVVYGQEPSRGEIKPYNYLLPVLELESELVFVKQLPADEGISYGHKYLTQAGDWIGTVPIGYGDGLNTNLVGYEVLVNGEIAKVVGKIAMDQLMVLLPHELPVGAKVTFIGKSGDQERTLEDMANYTGIDPWYLTTAFQERIKRELVD